MTNFVQLYKSTDLNAPPLSGQAGSLITVLNEILVDGYGWSNVAISGLTRSGTTATAMVSATNGLKIQPGMILTVSGATQSEYNITSTVLTSNTIAFTYTVANTATTPATGTPVVSSFLPITSISRIGNIATVILTNINNTLVSNNYVTINGANETDYNGTFQITVANTQAFSYTVANVPSTPATGTITYAKAGLGWSRPFTGNAVSQTYRSLDSGSNQFYLQVIDSGAVNAFTAQVYAAEVMSADQTVVSGQFPTVAQRANGLAWGKSTAASTALKAWTLIGDDKTFYYCPQSTASSGGNQDIYGFGYFIPYRTGDAYNTFLAGNDQFGGQGQSGLVSVTTAGSTGNLNAFTFYLPRTYTQLGTSINGAVMGTGIGNATRGDIVGLTPLMPGPNPVNTGYYFMPMMVYEQGAGPELRGRMPGYYTPLFPPNFGLYYEFTNLTGLPGVTLFCFPVYGTIPFVASFFGAGYFDKYGPWV